MTAMEDRKSLQIVMETLDELVKVSPSMPVQQALTYMLVALNEGASMLELKDMTDVKRSTMSRHLIDLGKRNRHMEPGFQLVDVRQDDYDMRKNQYVLSIKGRALADRFIKIVRKYADIR